jgi:hypothetical protein
MKLLRLAPIALLVIHWSCSKRIPESNTAPPVVPRVGWVIMTGDRDNPDAAYVCQSQPRTEECVLSATRPDQQVFASVHLFFHPAPADTKYTGTVRVGFMQTAGPVTPNVTVKAGDKPGQTTVIGLVLPSPGKHEMTIALVAEGEQRREIRERVQVAVQATQGAAR